MTTTTSTATTIGTVNVTRGRCIEENGKQLHDAIPFYQDLAFVLFHPRIEEIYQKYSAKHERIIFQRAFALGQSLANSNHGYTNHEVLAIVHEAITNSESRQLLFRDIVIAENGIEEARDNNLNNRAIEFVEAPSSTLI